MLVTYRMDGGDGVINPKEKRLSYSDLHCLDKWIQASKIILIQLVLCNPVSGLNL